MKVPRPPPPSSSGVTAVMKANRARDTEPELALRRALAARGITGYRTNVRDLPGRPDIAFTRYRLAIFVNGCFWHQHDCDAVRSIPPKSNPEYWATKFELNRQRDERKVRELESMGWHVLTLWECEISRDSKSCASRVANSRAAIAI
jgi:DNA mismatch endonuclease, patch repair protein